MFNNKSNKDKVFTNHGYLKIIERSIKRWNHHISHSLLPIRPLFWVSTSRQYSDLQGPGFWAKLFELFSRALHEYNKLVYFAS